MLGLDSLASAGYGPEAALTALLPLGIGGLHYLPAVMITITVTAILLYLSYRQTIAAYPNGGGAYTVTQDNFGKSFGVLAAVALLTDYLLNVCVATSAGVASVISVIPALHPHRLELCLAVLVSLTLMNLRGIRTSALALAVPVFVFVSTMTIVLVAGLFFTIKHGGHPVALVPPPALPPAKETLSTWLLLVTFANGCTAMTGIEAVSNGIPLFRKPAVKNAQRTLMIIVLILSGFLLGIAFLCPAYHIGAMNEEVPGYQTVLSQLAAAVMGRGVFYYAALSAIFVVLTYSAQTSFSAFPRVCRLLADDRFLPSAFANRGRRLVFSHGIIVLAVMSTVILVVFKGVTQKLIPLFAIGAFGAFLASQSGMVVHWLRKKGPQFRAKLLQNALGAITTFVALAIIIAAKFVQGAWITLLLVPVVCLLLFRIRKYYRSVRRKIKRSGEIEIADSLRPIVVVPVAEWNNVTEKAIRFGMLFSDKIIAVHVTTEHEDAEQIRQIWSKNVEAPAMSAGRSPPRLVFLDSPYRLFFQPILDFVDQEKKRNPGRLVAVVIPELVEPRWIDHLLHNQYGAGLKALLYLKRDEQTIVINMPWYLHENTREGTTK